MMTSLSPAKKSHCMLVSLSVKSGCYRAYRSGDKDKDVDQIT